MPMVTLRESIDTRHEALILEGLDFAPSCQARACRDGQPTATHLAVMLMCPCPPLPICEGCASELARAIQDHTMVGPAKCQGCAVRYAGDIGNWVRVEVMP